MAITVEFLKKLGVEDEAAQKIFAERSAELEKEKAKLNDVKSQLDEKNEAFKSLTSEFETLKASNATADDYKAKYEAIVAENEAKAKQAEADRIAKEKAESLDKRFEAAVGGRGFNHEAIRADYRKKFEAAVNDKANEGKSDEAIFHDLTKDDATAFIGVTATKLVGGTNKGISTASKYSTREEISNIKDTATRQAEILAHPNLFPEISE